MEKSSKEPKSLLKKSPLELLRWLTVGQWEAIDREYLERPLAEPMPSNSKTKRKTKKGSKDNKGNVPTTSMATIRFDWRVLIVLITAAVSLAFQEYYGDRSEFIHLFGATRSGKYFELESFGWWTGWRFLGYLVFPALVVVCMRGERLRDYFIRPTNFFKHFWIYGGLFLAVLPAVLIAANTDSFKLTYPFYKLANRSSFDFWAWQGMYWVQFISLEFFFRGFLLKALAPRFGSGSIFVMLIPYCMIHFGKPLPETLGAIIAGLVLGTLSMRTKSIWGGAFIHIAVALTMDSLAVADCPSAASGLRCPSH